MAGRNHHYVPQFYLRRFGHGSKQRSVSLFVLDAGRYVASTGISNQASSHGFYGPGDEVEHALEKLEGYFSAVLRQLDDGQVLSVFTGSAWVKLSGFVACQYLRTPMLAKQLTPLAEEQTHKVIEVLVQPLGLSHDAISADPKPALFAVEHIVPTTAVLLSLQPILLRAPFGHSFLTSDNPVVLYNPFAEGEGPYTEAVTGLNSAGLWVILPLSPTYTLLLVDPGVYHTPASHLATTVVLSRSEVRALNRLQIVNAEKVVYMSPGLLERYIRRLADGCRRFRELAADERLLSKAPSLEHGLRHMVNLGVSIRVVHVRPSFQRMPKQERVFLR